MHTYKGAALAASLAAALGAALLVSPSPAAAGSGDRAGGKQQQTITLLTGDRVTVGADGKVTGFRAGKGRADVGAVSRRARGHTYVIPRDALALLRTDRLDLGLFDVTRLVKAGYDDAHRRDTPLIVDYRGGAGATARARRREHSLTMWRAWTSSGTSTASAPMPSAPPRTARPTSGMH